MDYWAKSVAPSHELRRWYGHAPEKWDEFRRRYFAELDGNAAGVAALRAQLGSGANTLVYGSTEERLNNATALRAYLESLAPSGRRSGHRPGARLAASPRSARGK